MSKNLINRKETITDINIQCIGCLVQLLTVLAVTSYLRPLPQKHKVGDLAETGNILTGEVVGRRYSEYLEYYSPFL